MSVNVAGLDLSMTATGIATLNTGKSMDAIWSETIKTKGTGDDRLTVIKNEIRHALEEIFPVAFVLIEGQVFQSQSGAITSMVHGVVREMLTDRQYRYGIVPPSSLKKYATGRGGATKPDMAVEAYKRSSLSFANDNECDAFWLAVMAADHLGQPMFDLPKINRESLKKIEVRG